MAAPAAENSIKCVFQQRMLLFPGSSAVALHYKTQVKLQNSSQIGKNQEKIGKREKSACLYGVFSGAQHRNMHFTPFSSIFQNVGVPNTIAISIQGQIQ